MLYTNKHFWYDFCTTSVELCVPSSVEI